MGKISKEDPSQINSTAIEEILLVHNFVKDTVKSGDQYHPFQTIYENKKLKLTVKLEREGETSHSHADKYGITSVAVSFVLPRMCDTWATPQQQKALKPFINAMYPPEVAKQLNLRLGFLATPSSLSDYDMKHGIEKVFYKTDEFMGYHWRISKNIDPKIGFTSLAIYPNLN